MKIRKKLLAFCLAIPLLVGGISALLSYSAMKDFVLLEKPPLSPPGWLFPVVWTVLYLLMGFASYLVVTSNAGKEQIKSALTFYGIQLFFNFFWSIIFFNWGMYLFAFFWLVAMWIFILITAVKFYKIRPLAGYLLIPYILWVTFAGYLNLGIYFLN